jgi:FkbM family methyltransferase
LLESLLRRMGRELVSHETMERLRGRSELLNQYASIVREYKLLRGVDPEIGAELVRLLPHSHSQFRQDLFVLSETAFKRGGFFVEFGATNGLDLSNTALLERQFSWSGILAEPARVWRDSLHRNRRCKIDHRCVWTGTGETLRFSEVDAPELSTIHAFEKLDMHATLRGNREEYTVPTVSLLDLLRDHGAPPQIDYLSIDTEGSEYDILSAFDFSAFRIGIITVEHNFSPAREKIRGLLEPLGYVRKCGESSHVDDWYVLQTSP